MSVKVGEIQFKKEYSFNGSGNLGVSVAHSIVNRIKHVLAWKSG